MPNTSKTQAIFERSIRDVYGVLPQHTDRCAIRLLTIVTESVGPY